MIKTIKKLPQNIFVGLCVFNRNVMLCNFSDKEGSPSFVCINGNQGKIQFYFYFRLLLKELYKIKIKLKYDKQCRSKATNKNNFNKFLCSNISK